MTGATAWTWETRRGSAGVLHAPDTPTTSERVVREMLVDAPSIVLGSSQPLTDIDLDAAHRAGVGVTRRRSGGGAVLLVPGEHVWFDVWLPKDDVRWIDDVGRAGEWLADVWVEALAALGVPDLGVHRGPMQTSEWSSQVCFAGLGPGEVSTASRKLVGVSQRRTRDWARFQCLAHRRWDADATFSLLRAPHAERGAIQWRAGVAALDDAPVGDAFQAALARA